jgi:hypothetical protein
MNRLSEDIPAEPPTPRRGPVEAFLRLFSSIWLGVFLLTTLFVYSWIGSAGLPVPTILCGSEDALWRTDEFILSWLSQVHVRQMPGLEMSEFEWFHWWPFDVLIALICLTLVVATLRRIPFKPVNYGVWMIHTGIIILALGSVYYFGTKREGDTPVVRRMLVAKLPGHEAVSVPALPGNTLTIGEGDDRYDMTIAAIDPSWELLSGADAGDRAYKISVSVAHGSERFFRELLANYPQYTEDLVRSGDPNQPIARAKNVLGKSLVDEQIDLTLAPMPQDRFYLVDTAALYIRPVGGTSWTERPIDGLPRYNDRIASFDDVWPASTDPLPRPDPLSIDVTAAEDGDPLADSTLRVTHYLRYAVDQTRRQVGGDRLDPTAWVSLFIPGHATHEQQLNAFDRNQNMLAGGRVRMIHVDSDAAFEAVADRFTPKLVITVPGNEPVEIEIVDTARDNPDLLFQPIPGTPFEFRVTQFEDGMALFGDTLDSVALVEVKSPEKLFHRLVFERPGKTVDYSTGPNGEPMGEELPIEAAFAMAYRPGLGEVNLIAGPGEDELRSMTRSEAGEVETATVTPGATISLSDGSVMTVDRYAARTYRDTRPAIVPLTQRNRDAGVFYSKIRVELPTRGDEPQSVWLPFHHYVFEHDDEVVMRHRFVPTTFTAADGRAYEVLFSRERMDLPAPVVLRDFHLLEHVGGFTGSTLSIRDWVSDISFEVDGNWTPDQEVRLNAPSEHDGWWFFQAVWDPPIPEQNYRGLNYTVLGVGNRNGVNIMLVGCCISVIGMIYAFYIKPFIKRRRQKAVYAEAEAAKATRAKSITEPREPVVAGEKSS